MTYGAAAINSAVSEVSTAVNAMTTLGLVNSSNTNLGIQSAKCDLGASRLDTHKTFVNKLQDALSRGIGSMTDADLANESAKLQSLQAKQQLSIEALSIANSSAQSALSLFR